MHITRTDTSPTSVTLEIKTSHEQLTHGKDVVLKKFAKSISVPGFRKGHIPLNIVEKNIDQAVFHNEVIEHILNDAYSDALTKESLRPVTQPEITLTSFVPFTELTFKAVVTILAPIKLPDLTKIKKTLPKVTVAKADIDGVIDNLKTRMTEFDTVDTPAKNGDKVTIDFVGKDSKGKEVNGASGSNYPLVLGSSTFIPGFEENVVGLKKDDTKSFVVTFPKDYGVKALQLKKVTFEITVHEVAAPKEIELNDEFAAKVGPFTSMEELRDDIKQHLTKQKNDEARQKIEGEILNEIAEQVKLELPEVLVADQKQIVEQELMQNLSYRGLTRAEYLEQQNITEQQLIDEQILPEAQRRLKHGLILSEIANDKKIDVTKDELEQRLELYKQQYRNDPQMMAELDKPENRKDIAARVLTEKTIAYLFDLATKK